MAPRFPRSRRWVGAPPLIECIRRPLLVAAAIGLVDEPEPVALVEAPRRNVLLEDPQPEPRRQPLFGPLEQRATDAASQEIWTNVEMLHHVSFYGHEATDLTVPLSDVHFLIAQDDVVDEEGTSPRPCGCPGGTSSLPWRRGRAERSDLHPRSPLVGSAAFRSPHGVSRGAWLDRQVGSGDRALCSTDRQPSGWPRLPDQAEDLVD